MDAIINALTGGDVIGLVALMAANIILSIVAAIKKGVFSFRNLGDFVPKRLMPFIAYLVIAALASVSDQYVAAQVAVYAVLVALYGAGIAAAVKSLTGISIPNIFSEKRD